jgi:peroxiredoxin Q/BCP
MRAAALVQWMVLAALTGTVVVAAGCSNARAAEMELAAADRSTLRGQAAPDFALPDQDRRTVRLADFRGQWVVVYFYPANFTPGCACQAREFTELHGQFESLSAVVLGISPDTVASHKEVIEKSGVKVTLLSDADHAVMTKYGAWVETPFGGRVVRSTVLIDPEGRVAFHWPEVIPQGHADRVRAILRQIQHERAGTL